jgi:hypothetical protein
MKTNNAIVQVKMCERCGSTSTEGYEVVKVAGREFCSGCILESMAMQQFRDLKREEDSNTQAKPLQVNVGFQGTC